MLRAMKPVIGINGDVRADGDLYVRLKMRYVDAVRRAGGVPVVLPASDPEDAPAILDRLDGVVLSGGGDIDLRHRGIELHPSVDLMHPRRQSFDAALLRGLAERELPTLGICLGMQMMAFEAGGKLHQHLPDAGYSGILDHRAEHDVVVEPESKLAKILGTTRTRVVSHHHQGVAAVSDRFRIVAKSDDGVIEAFESADARFVIGVQWHPERDPESPQTARLFAALVEAARRRR